MGRISAAFIRVFTFIAATLVAGVSIFAAGASAALPVSGKVTFIKDDQVWLSNADGSSSQQLTNDGATYDAPVLSPDKTLVAAERTEGTGKSRIYIIPTNGDSEYQLSTEYKLYTGLSSTYSYDGSQFRPRWNPAGTRVAFYSREFAQPGGDPFHVYDAPLGGEGREFFNGYNPEYSPDGNSLAYEMYNQNGVDYVWRIKQVDLNALTIEELYRTSQPLGAFTWSPDSAKIAVVESQGEGMSGLTFMAANVHFSLQMTTFKSDATYTYVAHPNWSSSGSKIAVAGYKTDGSSDIVLYDVAGESFSALTNVTGDANYAFPVWESTNRYILSSYKDGVGSPNQLAVINVLTGAAVITSAVDSASTVDFDRDVKDWKATYVAPSQPQVLGTSTDELPPRSQPQVLGATTLPSTGLASSGMPAFTAAFILFGLVLIIGSLHESKK